jgi:hypothetical protein
MAMATTGLLEDFEEGGEEMNVKEWVNSAMQQRMEGDSIDTHISTIIMKLQLRSQDVSDNVEQLMSQILSAVPRTSREVDRIQNTSTVLKGDLKTVTTHLEKIEGGTHDSIETISVLHRSKTNMLAARNTLTQAANWSALRRNANMHFAAGELTAVAEQLDTMKNSLEVLQNIPEAEERQNTFMSLKKRLEVLVKPKLLEALAAKDADLMEFVGIYGKLGKLTTLHQEYAKARQADVHRFWFSYAGQDFVEWLPSFYDVVLQMLVHESGRCEQLFPDSAAQVLPTLLCESLAPLASSFRGRLEDTNSGKRPVSKMVDVQSLSGAFLEDAWKALLEKGVRGDAVLEACVQAVLEPYEQAIDEYRDAEEAELQQAATEADLSPTLKDSFFSDGVQGKDAAGAMGKAVEYVLATNPLVLQLGEESLERCLALTSGVGTLLAHFHAEAPP